MIRPSKSPTPAATATAPPRVAAHVLVGLAGELASALDRLLLDTLEPLFRLAYRFLGARPDLFDLVAGLRSGGTQQALGIADDGSQIVDELTGGG